MPGKVLYEFPSAANHKRLVLPPRARLVAHDIKVQVSGLDQALRKLHAAGKMQATQQGELSATQLRAPDVNPGTFFCGAGVCSTLQICGRSAADLRVHACDHA